MSTTTEGTFSHGGHNLYTKTWTPGGPVKAKLVFVHGFSEHINRYNAFFPLLADEGIQVFGWDQRGWGRSVTKPSEKGLTGPTSDVVADVAAFVKDKLPPADSSDAAGALPVFVMGHSMGGGEVITLASDARYRDLVSQVRGWILECPLVGFSPEDTPGSLKIFVGRLVGKLLPKQQLKHVVPPEHLSRDPVAVQSVKDDELCHNTGTLEGLASLLDRTAALNSGSVVLGAHVRGVFLMHGTSDKTCSHDAAVNWLKAQTNVEDKTTKSYEGAYHQLHADLCKEEVTRDLVAWIAERSGAQDSVPVESKL